MPDAAPSPYVAALAKQLGSRHASARIEAVHALREMGPHATTELLKLYRLARQQRRHARISALTAVTVTCCGFGCIALVLGSLGAFGGASVLPGLALCAAGMVPAYAAVLTGATQADAAHALALVGDKRAVGTLAEELARASEANRPTVVAGLIRRLPEVGEEDGALLDAAQRRALAIELERGCAQWVDLHPDMLPLGVAICGALARIGDVSAMERLRRVADLPVRTAPQERLQRAVLACLDCLRRREAEGRDAAILLRATDSPDAALLMRSAGPAGTAEEALLRPVEPGDKGDAGGAR